MSVPGRYQYSLSDLAKLGEHVANPNNIRWDLPKGGGKMPNTCVDIKRARSNQPNQRTQ